MAAQINRYKLIEEIRLDDLKSLGFKNGGSWINNKCEVFKAIPLANDIELNIGYSGKDDWNDFDFVLVLDDEFGQPYTPFYGDNYGKVITNFKTLQKIIQRYNEEMDKLSFIKRI